MKVNFFFCSFDFGHLLILTALSSLDFRKRPSSSLGQPLRGLTSSLRALSFSAVNLVGST